MLASSKFLGDMNVCEFWANWVSSACLSWVCMLPKGAKRACKVSWHVLSMNKHAPIHKKGINFYIQFCVFAAGRTAYTEHTKDHPAKNQAGPKIGLYLARVAPKCWHFKKNPHCQHDTIFANPLINTKTRIVFCSSAIILDKTSSGSVEFQL